MPNELDPIVDQWYQHRDKGEPLHVVAVDRSTGLIEVQSFDGDLEEFDFDTWHDMDVELTEQPEDWTGPFDDIESDDLGDAEITTTSQGWQTPLDTPSADTEMWQDPREVDDRDEEEGGRPLEPYADEEDATRKRL